MHSSDLDQPIRGGNGEGSDSQMPGSVLLDFTTCIDGRWNGTTACSTMRGGHRIQVTFWFALPPLVSYFSVYSPDLEPAAFPREPVVVATEEDIVLLRVVLGPRSAILEPDRFEYFVYQAGAVPSLQSIQHPGPSRSFGDFHVGLLRCRPKLDAHFYIIAALGYSMAPGCYDLHTFDSRTKVWDTKAALVQQQRGEHKSHVNSKVIVIGGEGGTMGWVDLWQGILFCDVLDKDPVIRYVSLPAPLNPDISMQGCPRTARDIAVIKGRIIYVEFQHHIVPGSVVNGNYIANGWTVSTWSRKAATDSFEDHWQQDCRVHASQIAAKNNPMGFELLPKFFDDQGAPLPTLERLHTGHPTLSLHDDNVVYLMSKINYRDTKAWVLAVDIRNRTLQGAAEFVLRRTLGMSFAYMCSWIGKHLLLLITSGTKGNLN